MYEPEFGTEWDSLDRESAIERAFALGVARVLGTDLREEYHRIVEAAETTYERSLVELAYEEGRRKAANENVPGRDAADVWTTLVAPERESPTDVPDGVDERRSLPPGLPSSLERSVRSSMPSDSRERLDLPDFLTRE